MDLTNMGIYCSGCAENFRIPLGNALLQRPITLVPSRSLSNPCLLITLAQSAPEPLISRTQACLKIIVTRPQPTTPAFKQQSR